MLTFPNCKINLGLHILEKRNDGYHNLETVFYPLPIKDVLEIIYKDSVDLEFSLSGMTIDGQLDKNICVKAYHLLKKDFPRLPTVQMHLHKAIPMGAGLGGGSADGTFALKLLDKKFNLGLAEAQLTNYALMLGSDCPFFIKNKPCLATGRGEIIETMTVNLSDYKFVIIYPGIHISTAWAFANIKPSYPVKSIKDIIYQPVTTWKEELQNDFETPVFEQYPAVKKIKSDLYHAGAVYASMTGSGSSVYGIFEKGEKISLSFPESYYVKELPGQLKQTV